MSTDFVTEKPIPFSKIKNFNHKGVKIDEVHSEGGVTLTDGKNIIWAAPYKGYVIFARYGANDPEKIMLSVIDYFGVGIYSEYDDEYRKILKQADKKRIVKNKKSGRKK